MFFMVLFIFLPRTRIRLPNYFDKPSVNCFTTTKRIWRLIWPTTLIFNKDTTDTLLVIGEC
jgi:hypothetical protein